MRRQATAYVLTIKSSLKTSATKLVKSLIEIIFGVALLTLGARTSFILPFTLVPFTLQTLFLTYLILLLGRRSWKSIVAYVVAGLCGLPVFAYGGGPLYVISPTFGYLIGFIIASIIVGRKVLGYIVSHRRYLIGAGLIQLIIYLCGMLWLFRWLTLSRIIDPLQALWSAFLVGVIPFIVWDMIKAYIALSIYIVSIKIYNRIKIGITPTIAMEN